MANQKEIKMVVTGEFGIGKTTFVEYVCKQKVTQDFECYPVKVKDSAGTEYTFTIYDTQSMEMLSSMTTFYYNNSRGIFLMFDLSNNKGLDQVRSYHDYITNMAHVNDALIYLVGMKKDLPQAVPEEEIRALADALGLPLFKISTTTQDGVDAMFQQMVDAVCRGLAPKASADKEPSLCPCLFV